MKHFLAVIYGIVFGVANVIPGVSGGTMLVTFGVYDKVCGAFALNFKEIKKNWKFLVFFGVGAVVGLVGFSFVITWLFTNFPTQTYMFFMGLILGSVPLIVRNATKNEKFRPYCIIPYLLALALVVGLASLEKANSSGDAVAYNTDGNVTTVTLTNNTDSTVTAWSFELQSGEITAVSGDVDFVFQGGKTEIIKDIFGIGYDTAPQTIVPKSDAVLDPGDSVSFTITTNGEFSLKYDCVYGMTVKFFFTLAAASVLAAVAMIIPGVSGSFIMVLLGTYSTVIAAVKDLDIITLIPVAAGVLLGLVFGAKLISWLMKKFRLAVFSAILGLVVGSLYAILPEGFGFNLTTLFGVITFVFGGAVSLLVGKNTEVE